MNRRHADRLVDACRSANCAADRPGNFPVYLLQAFSITWILVNHTYMMFIKCLHQQEQHMFAASASVRSKFIASCVTWVSRAVPGDRFVCRHPQMVGQALWCLAHTLWVGNSFMVTTSLGLMVHHLFGCWHGDRRLAAKYGEAFEKVGRACGLKRESTVVCGRVKLAALEV